MISFFNEAGLCITYTDSAESITEARDLSSQGAPVESDGFAFGDTDVCGVCLLSCWLFTGATSPIEGG